MNNIPYTDLRVRKIRSGVTQTVSFLRYITTHTNLTFVRIGMTVRTNKRIGKIIDVNGSGNWRVIISGRQSNLAKDPIITVHPTWCIAYYDAQGQIIQNWVNGRITPATGIPEQNTVNP